MNLLKPLQEFGFTATGGVAIYFLICFALVTAIGIAYIIMAILGWLK